MKIKSALLIAVGLTLAASAAWSQDQPAARAPAGAANTGTVPAPRGAGGGGGRQPAANWWSQAGGEGGPRRIVWAAQKDPETPYNAINKPIWHIADIIKSHSGQARWEQKALLNRDYDGRYIQMAPGDKTKCMFYADDRVFGWVFQGSLKVTIAGQDPNKVLPKGWVFNVAPRLTYCLENVGTTPVIMFKVTPAGQAPSYTEDVTPDPMPGWKYVKASITSTGGYDAYNIPFMNVDEYGASNRIGAKFLYDGHTSSNLNLADPIKELAPDTNWGHFHENMQETWLDVFGNVCARISGAGVVHGVYGDLINANEERWHRASSCPESATRSIRMAITPRSMEGQVHYYQPELQPGGGE